MRRAAVVIAICLAINLAGLAQSPQPPAAAPGPSPQQQLLGYFTGDWTIAGTTKISPNTPSVQFHSTDHGEWLPGGYFVEVKSVTHGPMGAAAPLCRRFAALTKFPSFAGAPALA